MAAFYPPQGSGGSTSSGGMSVASGSYTGNSAANRGIAHGLGKTPAIVFIFCTNDAYWFRIFSGFAYVACCPDYGGGNVFRAVTAMDSTNFYVGNSGDYEGSANLNNNTYYWVAMG